ncbi:MAG: C25 family cysteine peptidase [Candidatus Zixiibacteriota bacterium]
MRRTFAAVTIALCLASGSWAELHTIDIDQYSLHFDATQISVPDGSNKLAAVGADVRLSILSFVVRLQDSEQLSSIRYQTAVQETLGVVSDANVLIDQPTSIDSSYASLAHRIPDSMRLGRRPVVVEGETVLNGARYARLLVFPITVDSMGLLRSNRAIDLYVGSRKIEPADLIDDVTFAAIQSADKADVSRAADASVLDYVIVTSRVLADAFAPLAQYKNETGIRTQIAAIDSVLSLNPGRDDAERLREYFKQFYAQGGRYVLLGGDGHILPTRHAFDFNADTLPHLEEQQACDLYFADLTGEWDRDNDGIWGEPSDDRPDLTPELFVGRLPFDNIQQVTNYVEKLSEYETNPGFGDPTYLGRAFFFSSDQMRDYSGGQHNRIAEVYPATITVDTTSGVEQSSGSDPAPYNLPAAELLPVLSQGYGIVNIIAHGMATKFGVRSSGYNNAPSSAFRTDTTVVGLDQITRLDANHRTSLYYSLACDNGAFDKNLPPFNADQMCVATALLALKDAGAIAFVANSRWGWVGSSYLLQRSFFDSLLAHPDRPAVQAMYGAKAEHYYYRDVVYGQCFFGDPTLKIYNRVPDRLAVTVSAIYDSLVVSVTALTSPIIGCSVFVSLDGTVIKTGVTNTVGEVAFVNDLALGSRYMVSAIRPGGTVGQASYTPGIATDVADESETIPDRFSLAQNYPNPFNPSTVISYELPRASQVTLTVYNLLGQVVQTLRTGSETAGQHQIVWNARDGEGREFSSGTYFYRLEADGFSQTRKMMLVR